MKTSALKRTASLITALCLCTGILVQTVVATPAGTTLYTNTLGLAENFDYTNTISWNATHGREESYSFTLTPGGEVYPIVLYGSVMNTANSINSITNWAKEQGYNVLGAINSDFFDMSTGVPMGLVISNGKYISSPNNQTAVAFMKDGSAYITTPKIQMYMYNDGGAIEAWGQSGTKVDPETGEELPGPSDNTGKSIQVHNLNKQRYNTYINLFTTDFAATTKAEGDAREVVFKVIEGELVASGTVTLEVVSVSDVNGASTLKDGYYTLSVGKGSEYAPEFDKFAVGDTVRLVTVCGDEKLTDAVWVTGGGDILVRDGKVTDSSAWDRTLINKNPRTAVGIKEDGTTVYYVIDGRNGGHSNGITMSELANELLSQGCVDVINLDGGGSSAMSVRMIGDDLQTVVNTPSDGSQRRCGVYILFVTRQTRNGVAKYLGLSSEGSLVARNASVDLGTILASDAGHYATSAPADTSITPTSGKGTVEGTVFRAGDQSGGERLSLYSSTTGASGIATIHIISEATSMTVSLEGSSVALESLNVSPGDSVTFAASMRYNGRDVYSSASSYAFECDENLGAIDENGVFTASTVGGATGNIKVTYGSLTKKIAIEIKSSFVDMTNHWAEGYVEALAGAGIIKGYETSEGMKFMPEKNITREEVCVILVRMLGIDTSEYAETEMGFMDTGSISYWALDSVKAMISLGYMTGSQEGDGVYILPTTNISRMDLFTILGRIYPAEIEGVELTFVDSDEIGDWAVSGVLTMLASGVINGYEDNTIRPKNPATRAEVAKMMFMLG